MHTMLNLPASAAHQNNPNVVFRIHSEPKSMLLKNARITFNDSLLNPRAVGHLGSVGPVTDFTP